jgi:hypothetical protein
VLPDRFVFSASNSLLLFLISDRPKCAVVDPGAGAV